MVGFGVWSSCANAAIDAVTKIVMATKSLSLIGLYPFRVELAVDSAAPAIDLPVWPKLFKREQIDHSSGFNTALA
jgi:hypothetical protein